MTMTMTPTMQQPTQAPSQQEQVRNAVQDAQLAVEQANAAQEQAAVAQEQAAVAREQAQIAQEQAQREGTVVTGSGGRQEILLPNGRRIVINGDGVTIDGRAVSGVAPDLRNVVPQGVVDIVQTLGLTVVLCVVGLPLARAIARWMDRRTSAPASAPDVSKRLAAIENAVESVAVEVERISEGQRFTTRLLSEQAQREPVRPLAVGERV